MADLKLTVTFKDVPEKVLEKIKGLEIDLYNAVLNRSASQASILGNLTGELFCQKVTEAFKNGNIEPFLMMSEMMSEMVEHMEKLITNPKNN